MHAEAFAGAATQQLAVDRPGAAAVDAFFVLGPKVDALDARVAFDHALGVVAGVMGDRFDCDVVAGIDFKLRLQQFAEIAPVHRVGVRGQIMIGRLAGFGLRRGRRCQGAGAGPCGSGSAAGEESALEKAAPFAIEIVQELLAVKLKVWAGLIVSCAHSDIPPDHALKRRAFCRSHGEVAATYMPIWRCVWITPPPARAALREAETRRRPQPIRCAGRGRPATWNDDRSIRWPSL
jgi:hypothetical protein